MIAWVVYVLIVRVCLWFVWRNALVRYFGVVLV